MPKRRKRCGKQLTANDSTREREIQSLSNKLEHCHELNRILLRHSSIVQECGGFMYNPLNHHWVPAYYPGCDDIARALDQAREIATRFPSPEEMEKILSQRVHVLQLFNKEGFNVTDLQTIRTILRKWVIDITTALSVIEGSCDIVVHDAKYLQKLFSNQF